MSTQAVRVLAITNQKGGVGKTTTAINLGTALAAIGEQVLVVDLDPQGNASTGLGIAPDTRHVTTFDVLTGHATLLAAGVATSVPGLSIVPSNSDLVGTDAALAGDANRSFRLRDAVAALVASQGKDGRAPLTYVLIDCPPSLNLLTLNALAAADAVLVPVQCEFFALEGISQLKDTIDQIRATINPRLEIQGVVLTMHNVRAFFGAKVYETMIPRNVRVAEAPSHGKPILLYDYDSAGSQAYVKLATEIIERERHYKAA
jgi:chromosome partitioning protein